MSLLFDKLIKGPIFGCQQCGQCLLSQTAYICPMTCPKGLRNGPCGDTLDGACEVLPDRPCVWLRISDKDGQDDGLHLPFDASLVGSSSLANYVSGRDKATRLPHQYRFAARKDQGQLSKFAQRFERGQPVITFEITSPRDRSGLERVARIAQRVGPHVDGINSTTNAGGVPSLHSLETARVVATNGVPPIVQYCGGDQDTEAFRCQVTSALEDGFANFLVLTGDWNPNTKRELNPQHWFPMDSLQMVNVLAAQSGSSKRPFIGVASNAYTTPMEASIQRFHAKLQAGAHFTQTQVVTETAIFSDWLQQVRLTELGRGCRILASVPLVGKQRPYEILQHLPGVWIADDFKRSLDNSGNLALDGLHAARELISRLLQLDIDGVHLLNFGMPVDAVVDLIQEIRALPMHSAA